MAKPHTPPRLFFTVTNDLTYDQRMQRICGSLAQHGYDVLLIGRKRRNSLSLENTPFKQKRLNCFFEKGFAFYAEYNTRLFFFLLFSGLDGICAIDLDTILPCYFVSVIRNKKRVYDAHELFCEMKEVVTRPSRYKAWKKIEQFTLPHFPHAYTVNEYLAQEFKKMYGVGYTIIRSISVYEPAPELTRGNFILYQGAVNEGRCFEQLIPAMKTVAAKLIICGDGNFMGQAKKIMNDNGLQDKIAFKGMLMPAELRHYTRTARVGITLFEKDSLSNYYSLANRFFDYIHGGLPQVCVNYPVYAAINDQYHVADLVMGTNPESLSASINALLNGQERWQSMHENCLAAAAILNWQEEEKKLLAFYKNLF